MATTPVDKPGEASAGTQVFTIVDYIRRLKLVCVDIQRLRSNVTPQGAILLRDQLKSLAVMVSDGMAQAKSMPLAIRDEFIDQIRKVVASSGTPMPAEPIDPVKIPGVRMKHSSAELVFQDRLPRFMRKWADGDPEWRLLQCAVRFVDNQTFILGLAETKQLQYSIFHGTNGGDYKISKMALPDAQNMLTAAFKRGYAPISVKALASTIGYDNLENQQYSVIRMTSGADALR